jgi:integrase
MGDGDRLNPFAGLSFKERMKSKRPPFPPAWLKDKILKTAPLAGLNEEARGILLATIETGARPSELCNLREPDILVAAKVPHIRIVEHEDPEAPRELKTKASIRELPLVGVALAVFKKFPKGFPRYFGKEESACAAINKYLRENKLVPSPKHTLYSIRHTFEDRMKEAGIDGEMREIFFGHRRTRQEYGSGGALEWRKGLLKRMALPYEPGII